MSDPVASNIMKTGAVVWYAPLGESLPDETTVAAGEDWGGNWKRVGFTSAPVALTYEDSRMEIETEEFLAAIDEWRTKEVGTFETTLAEITGEYLQLFTDAAPSTTPAGASQVGYEEVDIGNQGRITKYAVGFEGIRYDASANALTFRLFGPVSSFKLNGKPEFSAKTDTYVQAPVLIKSFADPDNSGRLYRVQRVTAPATS
jgi:hypothetical protein